MDEDDQEVANILQDYIRSNGIPKGAGTRSKFNKLTTTFKERHQLGYHKYVFQADYPGTPKHTMEYATFVNSLFFNSIDEVYVMIL